MKRLYNKLVTFIDNLLLGRENAKMRSEYIRSIYSSDITSGTLEISEPVIDKPRQWHTDLVISADQIHCGTIEANSISVFDLDKGMVKQTNIADGSIHDNTIPDGSIILEGKLSPKEEEYIRQRFLDEISLASYRAYKAS